MTTHNNTFDLIVVNYQDHLTNADYLQDTLKSQLGFNITEIDLSKDVKVDLWDVSHQLASGYGTWKVLLTLKINGDKKEYPLTHHNESWYLSQKTVHDPSRADSEEELKEAYESFQYAFEAVVDANIQDIASACYAAAEQLTED